MDDLDKLINEGLKDSWLNDERVPRFTKPDPNTIAASTVIAKADDKTGLPAAERAALSFKTTPQGRLSYLEETYGKGKALDIGGEMYVNKDGNWIKVNEEGFGGLGDIASLSGPALGVLPGMAAGMFTENPALVGAADAGGDALRQSLGAMLPGDDQRSFQDRAFQSLLAGGFGAGSQFGLNALGRAISAVPGVTKNMRRFQQAGGAADMPATTSVLETLMPGERQSINVGFGAAAEDIGMKPTFGDLSQDPMAKGIEGALRRNPASAEIMQGSDLPNQHALYNYIRELASGADPEVLGQTLKKEGQAYLDNLISRRSQMVGPLFQQAAEESGGARVLTPENYMAMIEELKNKMDSPLVAGSESVAKQVQEYDRILKNLFFEPEEATTLTFDPVTKVLKTEKAVQGAPKPKNLTIEELQRGLQYLSDSAAGKGKLFADLDTAQERMLARRLKKALEQDFDELIKQDIPGAGTLRKARRGWKRYSDIINKTENSYLASTLENTVFGKDLVDKLLSPKGLSRTAKRKVVRYLRDANPAAVEDLKKVLFQKVLEDAVPAGSGMMPGSAPFSPSKGLSSLLKDTDLVENLFVGDPEGWLRTQNALKGMQMLASQLGAGSPTAPLQWAGKLITGMKFNPMFFRNMVNDILKPQAMARLLTQKNTAEALAELAKPRIKTKAVTKAIENLILDNYKYQIINNIGGFGNVPEARTP